MLVSPWMHWPAASAVKATEKPKGKAVKATKTKAKKAAE